jgi:GxxExxY protein
MRSKDSSTPDSGFAPAPASVNPAPVAPASSDCAPVLVRYLEEEGKQGEEEGWEEKLRKSLEPVPHELWDISGRFIDAAIEVHDHLGPGFTEVFYTRALHHELRRRGVAFASQVPIDVDYKMAIIGQFRLDLVIEDRLLVELKAVESISNVHIAQMLAYLKASRLRVGLIVNFNVARLQHGIRRFTWPR